MLKLKINRWLVLSRQSEVDELILHHMWRYLAPVCYKCSEKLNLKNRSVAEQLNATCLLNFFTYNLNRFLTDITATYATNLVKKTNH